MYGMNEAIPPSFTLPTLNIFMLIINIVVHRVKLRGSNPGELYDFYMVSFA